MIEQGIDGTSMASFARLAPQDRWALALYVGSLAYPAADAGKGEQSWKPMPICAVSPPDQPDPGQTRGTRCQAGRGEGDEIIGYLRRNPGAVAQQTSAPLALAARDSANRRRL